MATPSAFAHMIMNVSGVDSGIGANAVSNIGTPTFTAGKINNALTLDGSTDALNVDALATDIKTDTSGSIAFWVYPNNVDSVTKDIFSITDASAIPNFRINIKTGNLRVIVEESGSSKWFLLTHAISATEWSHWVIVQDGVACKIYKNGIDITGSFTLTGFDGSEWFADLTGIDSGRIGCVIYNAGANSVFFPGQIDDFRYYQNQVLTQQDVLNIYRGSVGTEDDPPDFWSVGFPHSQGFIIS